MGLWGPIWALLPPLKLPRDLRPGWICSNTSQLASRTTSEGRRTHLPCRGYTHPLPEGRAASALMESRLSPVGGQKTVADPGAHCPRQNFALLARNFCVQNVTSDRRTARIKQKIGEVSQDAPRLIVVEARRMGITNTAELSDASNCSRRSVVRRVRHHVGCTIGPLG